jgi:hypothetical protein
MRWVLLNTSRQAHRRHLEVSGRNNERSRGVGGAAIKQEAKMS